MEELSKKQIRAIVRWTNVCFKNALLEYYPKVFSNEKHGRLSTIELKDILMDLDLPTNNDEINNIYLKQICAMSTEALELVIRAHNAGIINRAQHTVDAIMTELFERAANSETKKL